MNCCGPAPGAELRAQFGEIDIYLFDQLLRGRFDRRGRVLDTGCGDGRNLWLLLRLGFTCFGVDRDPTAVERVRRLAGELAPQLPAQNFQAGQLDGLPWDAGSMDAVICSAVLYFASDNEHFARIVLELRRVLAPGGLFFARLASNIGIEDQVGPAGRARASTRRIRSLRRRRADALEWTERLGARMLNKRSNRRRAIPNSTQFF
jgi:SAM-dependent methyltransferase